MEEPSLREGFPLLTDEEQASLRTYGQTMFRSAGDTFFSEGEQTDFALLIEKGHVKVTVGKPPRIVAIRSHGEFVGEMAAVRKAPRSATVVAFDDVVAVFLPAAKWMQFLYDHPRAMHAQLRAADERTEQATRKIVESDLAVEQRLAKAFIELATTGFGESVEEGIVLRLSQLDLASLIGASKLDSVKKVIRAFKQKELIKTGRQVMVLLNPAVISDIANGNTTASAWSERRSRDAGPPAQ